MVTETCYDPQMIWSSKTKMEDHKKEKHSDLQTCDKIQTVCICCCGMIKTKCIFQLFAIIPLMTISCLLVMPPSSTQHGFKAAC